MIYIAVGSNLTGHYASLQDVVAAGLSRLEHYGISIIKSAPLYQTRAIGPKGQNDYINTVICARTMLSPRGLLKILHQVEADMGRVRRIKWGARIFDLDLLDYHGTISAYSTPLLPHPHMSQRGFVLYPLRDIAPGWHHPVRRQSIDKLIARLPLYMRHGVRKLK